MTTNSLSGSFAAGKADALAGRKANPAGQYSQIKYMSAYHIWDTRTKAANAARQDKHRKKNPIGHCATCFATRREQAFEIYDSANDSYFCDDECEAGRKDIDE